MRLGGRAAITALNGGGLYHQRCGVGHSLTGDTTVRPSVRRSGFVKNFCAASPRDLNTLIRRCGAGPNGTVNWIEAVRLLQGALYMNMVPTHQSYRSVIESVAASCTELDVMQRLVQRVSGGSTRSAVTLHRCLLKSLAHHQPHVALDVLVTQASAAHAQRRAPLDIAVVSGVLDRVVFGPGNTESSMSFDSVVAARQSTWRKVLSMLPLLEEQRCPPTTPMVEALLCACTCDRTTFWKVAASLMMSVVRGSTSRRATLPSLESREFLESPPIVGVASVTPPMAAYFLTAVAGSAMWASAISLVLRQSTRDVLKDPRVQMAFAVCLSRSSAVDAGGAWQKGLALSDRVLTQHPEYGKDDRWDVLEQCVTRIPWRAALAYMQRSATGTALIDDTGIACCSATPPPPSPVALAAWVACRAQLVGQLPEAVALHWMKAHPLVAAARLTTDIQQGRTDNTWYRLHWADALAAASYAFTHHEASTQLDHDRCRQKLLVAVVCFEAARTRCTLDGLDTLAHVTFPRWSGISHSPPPPLSPDNTEEAQSHAVQLLDPPHIRELLSILSSMPSSSPRSSWDAATRILLEPGRTSAVPDPRGLATNDKALHAVMSWLAGERGTHEGSPREYATGCWAASLSVCARIHSNSLRRCEALEHLLAGQQLWEQAIWYSKLCDLDGHQQPSSADTTTIRLFGLALCASLEQYSAVRSILRAIGVKSETERFLLDKAELDHEERIIRSRMSAAEERAFCGCLTAQAACTSPDVPHAWPFSTHVNRHPVVPLSLSYLAQCGWLLLLESSAQQRGACDAAEKDISTMMSYVQAKFPHVRETQWPRSLQMLSCWLWGYRQPDTNPWEGPSLIGEPADDVFEEGYCKRWAAQLLRDNPHVSHLDLPQMGLDDDCYIAAISGMWCRLLTTMSHPNVDRTPLFVVSIRVLSWVLEHQKDPPPCNHIDSSPPEILLLVSLLDRVLVTILQDRKNAMEVVVREQPHVLHAADRVLHWGLQMLQQRRVNHAELLVGTCLDGALVARAAWDAAALMEPLDAGVSAAEAAMEPPQGCLIAVAAVEFMVYSSNAVPRGDVLEQVALALRTAEQRNESSALRLSQAQRTMRDAEWGSLWARLVRCVSDPRVLSSAAAPYGCLATRAAMLASRGRWSNALQLLHQSVGVAPEASVVGVVRAMKHIHAAMTQLCASEPSSIEAGVMQGPSNFTRSEILGECIGSGHHRWASAMTLMSALEEHSLQDAVRPSTVVFSAAHLRRVLVGCAVSTRDAQCILRVLDILHRQYHFTPQPEDLSAILREFDLTCALAANMSADEALKHATSVIVYMCKRHHRTIQSPSQRDIQTLLNLCHWASSGALRNAIHRFGELRGILKGTQIVHAMEGMVEQVSPTFVAEQVVPLGAGESIPAPPSFSTTWFSESIDEHYRSNHPSMHVDYWTPQRMRLLSEYVPQLQAAEDADKHHVHHGSAEVISHERPSQLRKVAADIVDRVLRGAIPTEALVTVWKHPASRERLVRAHYAQKDGEDVAHALPQPQIAPGARPSNGGRVPRAVMQFAAIHAPWIRYGSTTLLNRRAVAALGHEVAEAWPAHRLRTVLNVFRKQIARQLHHHQSRCVGGGTEATIEEFPPEPASARAQQRTQANPWQDKECVDNLLTSIPMLVRLLPFVDNHTPLILRESERDAHETCSYARRDLLEAACSSVFHHSITAKQLETLWPHLMAHVCLLHDTRWPPDVEAELVTAVLQNLQGVCPRFLSTKPDASHDAIQRYWALFHPILAPGAAFHTLEMRYVAEHYFIPLDRAEEHARSSEGGNVQESPIMDVCSTIASTVFPLSAERRPHTSFRYHSADDVLVLWRKSKTTLQDFWRTSAADSSCAHVGRYSVDEGCTYEAQDARDDGAVDIVCGAIRTQQPRNRAARSIERRPVPEAPSSRAVAPACPPGAVHQRLGGSTSVERTPHSREVLLTATTAQQASSLARTGQMVVPARRGGSLRWRVALSLLQWSSVASSAEPVRPLLLSSDRTTRRASRAEENTPPSSSAILPSILPVARLCQSDGGFKLDETRAMIEQCVGHVSDASWNTVCDRLAPLGGDLVRQHQQQSDDPRWHAVVSAIDGLRDTLPIVLLAPLLELLQWVLMSERQGTQHSMEQLHDSVASFREWLGHCPMSVEQRAALRCVLDEFWLPLAHDDSNVRSWLMKSLW